MDIHNIILSLQDALNQAKLSAYTTNPRRKKNKHHKHQSKQLPSLTILNTKSSKMVHHNSAPVPDGQKLLSAITPPPLSAPANANTDEQDISLQITSTYPGGYQHPPPLENRNSAPEIVVFSPGRELPKLPISQELPTQHTSKKNLNSHGIEERINRAKARVLQNGGLFGGSIDSNSYIEEDIIAQGSPSPVYHTISPGPSSSGSGHVRQKLSTRFHSAQKLNYKLAALSSFASAASANVRRSRTFNISDVHDQLTIVGNGGYNNNIYTNNEPPVTTTNYYTKGSKSGS